MTRRRPGMSLTEVLVALFIMALGTIAILTMFPLGMMQMGQALKDDRTAQAAAQADGYMRWYWKTQVVENPSAATTEQFVAAFDDPNSNLGAGLQHTGLASAAGSKGPSYPVFVDPMGFAFSSWQDGAPFQSWVGNQNVPRRSLALVAAQPSPYPQRVCSLMDGMGYDAGGTGTPAINAGGNIDREMRYNWLWVVQRPDNTDRTTARMTVVVFDRRSFLYAPPGAEAAFTTVPNGVSGTPGATSVCFPTNTNLGVQKGGWIMDATISPALGVMNANFYRVVSVTDDGTFLNVELQTPIKVDALPATNPRTFIVLAGVSEVFERPNLKASDF
jgi:hypothetical protein